MLSVADVTWTMSFILAALGTAWTQQDGPLSKEEIKQLLDANFSQLADADRSRRADEIWSLMTDGSRSGEMSKSLNAFVRKKLTRGESYASAVARTARAYSNTQRTHVDDEAKILEFPASFEGREANAILNVLTSNMSELFVDRLIPDSQTSERIMEQARTALREVRDAAASHLSGTVAELLADKWSEKMWKQFSSGLVAPARGGLSRALTEEETETLRELIRKSFEGVGRTDVQEADAKFLRDGVLPEEWTPAMKSLDAVFQVIFKMKSFELPKSMAASAEHRNLRTEITNWFSRAHQEVSTKRYEKEVLEYEAHRNDASPQLPQPAQTDQADQAKPADLKVEAPQAAHDDRSERGRRGAIPVVGWAVAVLLFSALAAIALRAAKRT